MTSLRRSGTLTVAIGFLALQQQQDPVMMGNAVVDSAAVARAAYARGSAAFRAGNLGPARAEMARAARAWPTQPTYHWARVVIGLRMSDTAAVRDALTRYADLGLGRDLTTDSTLRRLTTLPAFRDLASRHAAHLAPLRRSRAVAVLPDSTFFPEGMDIDPRTGFFYVASIRHRTIAELTPRGDYIREILPRGGVGLGAMMAVRVDPQRGVLWATTSGIPQAEGYQPGDSTIHRLLRIRLPEGEIDGRWEVPGAGHTLGDVALGPLGDVFFSDSQEPVLYRFAPDSNEMRPYRHPLFRSLQGIAPAPGALKVFVADYSHGLLKVDIASGEVTRLIDAPNSTSLGCDGIAWHDGALIAVQNGVFPPRVMRFELDSGWTRIVSADVLDRNVPIADEPTIGAIFGDEFVYVANSQWEKYSPTGELLPRAVLRRPVLLSVPVRR